MRLSKCIGAALSFLSTAAEGPEILTGRDLKGGESLAQESLLGVSLTVTSVCL